MATKFTSIAVVDDDKFVLKALKRLLRSHGYDAVTYASAREFLTVLADRQPDCLILDLQMPNIGGLELLDHLSRQGISLPTIVITAQSGRQIAQRCVAAGAAAILSKPIQDALLFSAITELSTR